MGRVALTISCMSTSAGTTTVCMSRFITTITAIIASGHVTIHGGNHNGFHSHVSAAHFHHVFRAPHRYRIGMWHAPRGFYYRRFGIGERVPAVLLVSSYFLNDYYDYGLEDPDDGYVWVRDGDDAVLVDEDTGEVIEVEYDVFY